MASSYFDLTAANAILKEYYSDQRVMNMVYKKNPALALVKKSTDFEGKYKPIPIISGVSQGRSSTFSNAQGNQSAVQVESFFLTRQADYSIATINQLSKAA